MFYIHIITENDRIENTGDKTYKVIMEETVLDPSAMTQEHIYKLQCGGSEFYIYCPEIREGNTNDDRHLNLPEFLIPGRPYPTYVYLYTITIYCLNPQMGQREAARRTQKRFGLNTFSHTTLGRAMKRLEKLLKENINEPQNEKEQTANPAVGVKKSFPKVGQTKDRRDKIAAYLKKASNCDKPLKKEARSQLNSPVYKCPPYIGPFIEACSRIIAYTFAKYRRLLL